MKIKEKFGKAKVRQTWKRRLTGVLAGIIVFTTTYALVLPAVTLDESMADGEPGLVLETPMTETEQTEAEQAVESAAEEVEDETAEEAAEPVAEDPAAENEELVAEVTEPVAEEPAKEDVEAFAVVKEADPAVPETVEIAEETPAESEPAEEDPGEAEPIDAEAAETEPTNAETVAAESEEEAVAPVEGETEENAEQAESLDVVVPEDDSEETATPAENAEETAPAEDVEETLPAENEKENTEEAAAPAESTVEDSSVPEAESTEEPAVPEESKDEESDEESSAEENSIEESSKNEESSAEENSVIEESKPEEPADVEDAATWDAMIAALALNGDWAEDLLTVAQSQSGYKASQTNFIVDENGVQKAYTRYGAWHGEPYEDWNSLFVLFCLNYAGVSATVMPQDADIAAWAEALAEAELYAEATDEFIPVPGDLVFFSEDGTTANRVGIVEEVALDTNYITVIEGDAVDGVKYSAYKLNAAGILGYGLLPENPSYLPAQDFEAQADDVKVVVNAAEGAFPAGTTMTAELVEDEEILTAAAAAVEEATKGEVRSAKAVDIVFYNRRGEEIEPQAAVRVSMSSAVVKEAEAIEVVHVDNEGTAEVVAQAEDVETAEDEVVFDADGFSVYVIVGTETLTTNYITAEGDTYLVTVTYGPDAKIPQGSRLEVKEVRPEEDDYAAYKADAAAALNASEQEMNYIKLLDITIMNGTEKVEIAAPVDVEIKLLDKIVIETEKEAENPAENNRTDRDEIRVVHFGDNAQEVEAGNKGETVSFSADSFSVYAIVSTTVNADFLTADGKTLKVTVVFDKDEPLPANAVLEVKELEEQEDEKLWGDRYQRLSNVLYAKYGKSKTGESRFLSISIIADGQEYKPKYPVQVKIRYDETIYGKEDRLVTVHYPDNENNENDEDELNEAFIEEAEILESRNMISGDTVIETVFDTTGFSDYDLTTLGEDDSPEYESFKEPEMPSEEEPVKAPVLKAAGVRSVGDVPEHLKEIEDNGDGTYTIDLSVKGDADTTVEEAGNVNVLIVYDHSSSMTSSVSGGTATRADQAEDVVYDFVHSLFGYQSSTNPSNIQVGLVRFARTADSTTNWTSNESTITQYFDDGGTDGRTNQNYSQSNNANNGTNWQSALGAAINLLNSADNDPTFVIFVTDGAPTASGNGNNAINPSGATLNQLRPFYEAAQANARSIQTRNNTTLYGIYCYGTEADLLDDLMYYSNTGTARNARTQTDLPVDHYYNTANTAALSTAIDEIFSQIVEALGITAVSIHDGTTNQVTTTTGEISELLEVDEDTYKYWISIPYTNNRFTRIDLVSGEEITYNLRNNGNGTVTVTWGSNSVTLTGTMVNGVFKYQWTEANALYNYAPPAAHMANGAVDWDLSSVGTLLNDVTYTVSFECYPSQYTLDLIADLKNGKPYSSLDPNEQLYLHQNGNDYTLSTNTEATLTYSDSRNNTGPTTTGFNEVEPQSTAATKAISITKDWSNILDDRTKPDSLTMHVTRDGTDTYELILNDADHWHDEAFISYGIMTIHDGNIVLKTPGHDYSFSEPQDLEYLWELNVPILRPMLINAKETMLVKVEADEAPAMSGANATTVSGGVTYYKLTIDGTAHYYKVDEAVASLTAVNNRRSYLNVTKKVDEANAPANAEFSFDMTVVNSKASEGSESDTDSDYWVWFSVYDTINNTTVSGDALTISGTNLQGPNNSGYYWIPSGNTVTVGMKKGYNIRFLNLPTGSTYSIVESSTMPEESFSLESITGTRHFKNDDGVEQDESTGTKTAYGISGSIEYANSNYTMIFDNKYSTIDVKLEKDDENGNTISGSVFDLNKYGTSWTSIQTDVKPGDTATSTQNPVDLGGLGIGRYRLTETKAPDGYIILTNHVYFEVYKDTDGVLKARLTDETGAAVTSPTDIAAIDGPGTGDTPTYIITVTNTPGAALPMTGGSGTLPYTLGGIALIMASALMYGFRMRRRERRLN